MPERWSAEDLPDLGGRRIVVTGGNSGLGFEAARALARKAARLTLACRDLGKAHAARERLLAESPGADVALLELDLADLSSVRKAAETFRAGTDALHVLLNNAGIMAIPRRETADGFEMQLGTNHLGHFALTGLLIELLLATPGSRVVNVSSTAHRIGRMHWDDLQLERSYTKWGAYAQSKLANLLFTHELQRRLTERGADTIAVAAHPGYAATNLQFADARMRGSSAGERLWHAINGLFAQSAEMGALPLLRAAAAPGVRGGDYFGPDRLAESRGHPVKVGSSRRSRDAADAARLWQVSEQLTGVRFDALAG
jgi:NAD(P)-dependent dehydrogenase (short-subunit alcohol dehydrogenase family)